MRALRAEDSLGPEVDGIHGGLRSKFDEILLSLGGAGTGAEVDEHMGPYLDLAGFSRSMALAFLGRIAGFSMESPREEGESWVLFSSEEAQEHVKSANDSLAKLAWETPGVLVDKALAQVAVSVNVSKDSVETALRVNERLRIGPSGGIYVVRGLSGIRHADRIVMVLRSIGKPAQVGCSTNLELPDLSCKRLSDRCRVACKGVRLGSPRTVERGPLDHGS